jgi:hypothetical protein
MEDERFGARFGLGVLATWRVTHLLAEEDGPGDLVVRLRARAGDGWQGRLMDCFYCLSVWTAMPFALAVARRRRDAPVAVLALSGAACLLERVSALGAHTTQLEGGPRDVLWRQAQCDEARHEGSGAPAEWPATATAAAAATDRADTAADAAVGVGAGGPGGHLRALDE